MFCSWKSRLVALRCTHRWLITVHVVRRRFWLIKKRINIVLLPNSKRLPGSHIKWHIDYLHKRNITTGVRGSRAKSPQVYLSKTRSVELVVGDLLRLLLLHKSILEGSIKFLELFLNSCLLLAKSIRENWSIVGPDCAIHTVHCIVDFRVVKVALFLYCFCSSKSEIYILVYLLRWFR